MNPAQTPPPGDDSDAKRIVLAISAALLILGVTYRLGEAQAPRLPPTGGDPPDMPFAPPAEAAIPAGPDGDAIRRGQQIFVATAAHAGKYVGNGMTCSNCHLDAGRRADAAPMWAAWGNYPAYRAKNGRMNTMEDRIRDCFTYSMNAPASPSGGPPPFGDDIYRDLQSYFAWLATGAPAGRSLPGRGFAKLTPTPLGHDPVRGAEVFASQCAACHGGDGKGQIKPDGSYSTPPLWGQQSYNWGAGMAGVASAAGFIKVNMPYGQGNTLTNQQAWDVAAYIDSRERPRDPRQTGTVEDARSRFHPSGDYYGQELDGHTLGAGVR
ncbi:MAG: c-type cytochrome [Candidatus Sphingomonas colombiensis]|nr:c-type cytochrome [Sphingomonas sp.]WEK42463.1 MAG: c-type cytochrome [Sphingomonas sp.]